MKPGSFKLVSDLQARGDALGVHVLQLDTEQGGQVFVTAHGWVPAIAVVWLREPAPTTCTAHGKGLPVAIESTSIAGSSAAKLTFVSASFYVGKGVRRTRHGKVVYAPAAKIQRQPATVALAITGLSRGSHPLTVKVALAKLRPTGRRKASPAITKTLATTFTVC